jgi:phage recombination protein Bet
MSKIKPESDIGGTLPFIGANGPIPFDLSPEFLARIDKIEARIDKMALAFKDMHASKKSSGISFDAKQLELIKSVAAVGATEKELKSLIYLAEQYELDPLKKEIIFIKGRTPLTTRDGLLKIANRDPQFDGIGGDAVYEGDVITKGDNEALHISYGPDHLAFNHAKLKGAFANVYRKDRSKATSVFVSMRDYLKDNQIWKQYPNAMILKVAESMALKRAFSLSGLTSQEEVGE